jgi:hypothetical protein
LIIKTYPDFASMANKPVITGEYISETLIKINIDYSAANSDDGKPYEILVIAKEQSTKL